MSFDVHLHEHVHVEIRDLSEKTNIYGPSQAATWAHAYEARCKILQIWNNLPRIHNPLRIEYPLNPSHQMNLFGAARVMHELLLE